MKLLEVVTPPPYIYQFKEEVCRHLLSIANHQNKLLSMVKKAKLMLHRTSPQYKYRYQVTCNHKEYTELQKNHVCTQCRDIFKTDMGKSN